MRCFVQPNTLSLLGGAKTSSSDFRPVSPDSFDDILSNEQQFCRILGQDS
jgi:hypothetical protein